MDLVVFPSRPLRGEVSLPGDKSLSHRAALFGALAEGDSRLENFLVAGVTRTMLNGLSALGVGWELDDTTLTVAGLGIDGLLAPKALLDCGNSATTLRLLTGALAAAGLPAALGGSPGLQRRPMNRIVEPLRAMGVSIEASKGGRAPLTLSPRPAQQRLRALRYELPVASAQVQTALLLAGLAADGPTTLTIPGPCRDHTQRLLTSMGLTIETRSVGEHGAHTVTLEPPSRPLRPLSFVLPGDFSTAAFLIVGALITPGSDITLRNVGLNPTRTGLLDAFSQMGASISVTRKGERQGEPFGDLNVLHSPLRGTAVEGPLVVRMIDEFPAFAIAAAHADGATVVRDARELRLKESDRINSLVRGLGGLGVKVQERDDGFELRGGQAAAGGVARPNSDHRLAMAFATSGLAARNPITVRDAEIIDESFPGFAETLRSLGSDVQVAN